MWTFVVEPQPMSGARLVMYAPERHTCEVVRAGLEKRWAAKSPPVSLPAECRLVVVGAGADYWVYASHGQAGFGALGWSDREKCMALRATSAEQYHGGWGFGECRPVALDFGPLAAPGSPCAADNTTPMFGYNPRHTPNRCDVQFIEDVTRNGKSRSQASLEVANIGWRALRAKDLDTAIKRFNQAWLLDRDNAPALWGFGVWEAMNERHGKAEDFLRQALAIETRDPGLYVDLGRTIMINGAQGNDGAKLREARTLFASAKQLNQNFLQAYVQEAALDVVEGKYADAWQEVVAGERIDAHGVDPDLLAELETRMPRPTR
jgi:tetratricopeptide (TPR) repeat protein